MHGLVTVLPDPEYSKVTALWQGLADRFDLRGIDVTPYPHFSWNIGSDYDKNALTAAMCEIAAGVAPLKVHTDGIGLFASPRPVLFIRVIRTPQLNDLHRMLWERMQSIASGLSLYYNPDTWQPHISLAYGDLCQNQVDAVRLWLTKQNNFRWEFTANNLSFIYEPNGNVGELQIRCPLLG